MIAKLIGLSIAGALGTLARYGLAGAMHRLLGEGFPWGTFVVNVIGSFLFGLVWMASTERNLLSAEARFYVLTGFMGAFTTFSTYMFESGQFLRASQPWLCAANLAGQIVLGMIAMFAGFAAGKLL